MAEPQEVIETAVGPGSVEELGIDPKPRLEGIGDYNYVELLNPLSVTFIAQVALTTDVSVAMPIGENNPEGAGLTRSENDIRQVYGFDLRAQAQKSGKKHILNRISIESGKTVKLLGGEAKVALNQLVNVVMQREGKGALLANAHERRSVEDRIVQRVGNLQEVMGNAPLSVQEQLKTALETINDQPQRLIQGADNGSEEFPGLNQDNSVGSGADSRQSDQSQPTPDAPPKRGPGRPPAQKPA